MFGSFFDTTEVDQYADWVVEEVKKAVPLGRSVKNAADRVNQLSSVLGSRTAEFARASRLNIYKKARLAERVRNGLKDLGYPAAFIESLSVDLLTRIATASKRAG